MYPLEDPFRITHGDLISSLDQDCGVQTIGHRSVGNPVRSHAVVNPSTQLYLDAKRFTLPLEATDSTDAQGPPQFGIGPSSRPLADRTAAGGWTWLVART